MKPSALVVVGIMIVAVLSDMAFGQVKSDEPIKTTLCELLKTPEKFNGKMVEVRATVKSGFEWGGLTDASCSANLLSDNDRFPALEGRTGEYAFIHSFSDLKNLKHLKWKRIIRPTPVRVVEDQSYKQYEHYVGQRLKRADGDVCFECPLYEVTLTVTGRFDHLEQPLILVRENHREKPTTYNAGFGHLNASLNRLVWQSVSEVVAKAIDPSVYQRDK